MTQEKPNIKANEKFSATEAARILGISTKTLRRHTQAGFIRCSVLKCNNRPRYTGSEIIRYWGAEYI